MIRKSASNLYYPKILMIIREYPMPIMVIELRKPRLHIKIKTKASNLIFFIVGHFCARIITIIILLM